MKTSAGKFLFWLLVCFASLGISSLVFRASMSSTNKMVLGLSCIIDVLLLAFVVFVDGWGQAGNLKEAKVGDFPVNWILVFDNGYLVQIRFNTRDVIVFIENWQIDETIRSSEHLISIYYDQYDVRHCVIKAEEVLRAKGDYTGEY